MDNVHYLKKGTLAQRAQVAVSSSGLVRVHLSIIAALTCWRVMGGSPTPRHTKPSSHDYTQSGLKGNSFLLHISKRRHFPRSSTSHIPKKESWARWQISRALQALLWMFLHGQPALTDAISAYLSRLSVDFVKQRYSAVPHRKSAHAALLFFPYELKTRRRKTEGREEDSCSRAI